MRALGLLISVNLVCCGGGDPSTSLEGVYEISTWTENPDGCDAEGPSVLPHPFGTTHFYVKNDSFFGQDFVNVVGCEGVTDCQEEAKDVTFDLSFFGPLLSGNDDEGWTSDESSCSGGGTIEYPELLMRSEGEGALILESKVKTLDDPPKDNEGFLDCEAGFAQVAPLPCEKLVVVRGTLVDAL